MERTIIIIRIDSSCLDQEIADIARLSRAGYNNLNFLIPTVQVLKRKVQGQHEFDQKALLFNYGFLEIPVEYAKSPIYLNDIRNTSRLISGFFYYKDQDLAFERILLKEREFQQGELRSFTQVLVHQVSRESVDRLFQVAKTLDVYDTAEEFEIGSYVMLQGYPFEGMGATILEKYGKKIRVELVDSAMIVEIERGNVYYSSYMDTT